MTALLQGKPPGRDRLGFKTFFHHRSHSPGESQGVRDGLTLDNPGLIQQQESRLLNNGVNAFCDLGLFQEFRDERMVCIDFENPRCRLRYLIMLFQQSLNVHVHVTVVSNQANWTVSKTFRRAHVFHFVAQGYFERGD